MLRISNPNKKYVVILVGAGGGWVGVKTNVSDHLRAKLIIIFTYFWTFKGHLKKVFYALQKQQF